MTNIVNTYASSIVTIFKDVTEIYERNAEIIKQAENELVDLEHEIELSNPKNARDGYKIYKEIREVRIRRRQAKNENELLKDLYDLLKEQSSQKFRNKIQQIQGNAAKIEKLQENRTYTPRQRTDLTITDQHCEANKPFETLLSDFKKEKVTVVNGKFRK